MVSFNIINNLNQNKMKAKLIKVNDNQLDGGFYILRDLNGNPIALEGNLSLKNCQAIERGYDLNELAYHNSLLYTWLETDERDKTLISKYGVEGFKAGFQKAVELMGDKKFSEEDVILIAEYIRVASQSTPNVRTKELFNEYQSLQQMEWKVNIEMEEYEPLYGEGSTTRPKLDNDGCLILKRI